MPIRSYSVRRGAVLDLPRVRNVGARPSFVEVAGRRFIIDPGEWLELSELPQGESAVTVGDGVEFVVAGVNPVKPIDNAGN